MWPGDKVTECQLIWEHLPKSRSLPPASQQRPCHTLGGHLCGARFWAPVPRVAVPTARW